MTIDLGNRHIEIADLHQQLSMLEATTQPSQQTSDSLAGDIAALRHQLHDAEDLNTQLKHEYITLEAEYTRANEQTAQILAQLSLYQGSGNTTRSRIDELMSQVASMEDRHSEYIQRISELEYTIQSARSTDADRQHHIQQLQATITELQQKTVKLNDALLIEEQKYDRLSKINEQIDSKFGEKAEECRRLQAEVTTMQGRSHARKLSVLTDRMQLKDEQIEQLSATIRDIKPTLLSPSSSTTPPHQPRTPLDLNSQSTFSLTSPPEPNSKLRMVIAKHEVLHYRVVLRLNDLFDELLTEAVLKLGASAQSLQTLKTGAITQQELLRLLDLLPLAIVQEMQQWEELVAARETDIDRQLTVNQQLSDNMQSIAEELAEKQQQRIALLMELNTVKDQRDALTIQLKHPHALAQLHDQAG